VARQDGRLPGRPESRARALVFHDGSVPLTAGKATTMTSYKVGYFIGSLAKSSINRTLSKALIRVAPRSSS
jgi:hypothetical protein